MGGGEGRWKAVKGKNECAPRLAERRRGPPCIPVRRQHLDGPRNIGPTWDTLVPEAAGRWAELEAAPTLELRQQADGE